MRKLTFVLGTFAVLALAAPIGSAEEKQTSASEKSEQITSSSGKQTKKTVKKVEHADGTSAETTTITTTNKKGSKAAANADPVRVEKSEKTQRDVTLAGTLRTKKTSKVENRDGTGKETTTVTETK